MRATVVEAENVPESMSQLREAKASDQAQINSELKAASDFRRTAPCNTVPVEAARLVIERVAKQENFDFRVPKVQPHNLKNQPTERERKILEFFESNNASEFTEVSEANNELIYARPIRLTQDCLVCHGNPSTSLACNGRDPLGFPIENWNAGEVHGAFVFKAKLDRVDKVAQAGMLQTMMWTLPPTVAIGFGFLWFCRREVISP
jgi:methyl-accepting chemotaxis protein